MIDLANYNNEYASNGAGWPYGVAAGGVVYRKHGSSYKYLVLGRNDKSGVSYHLPKGTLHINETLEQCAIREIREEAGVSVKLKTYLGGRHAVYLYNDKNYDKIFHYYAAEYLNDDNIMDAEHDFTEWCSYKEALDKLQSNAKQEYIFLKRCKDYLNNYEKS